MGPLSRLKGPKCPCTLLSRRSKRETTMLNSSSKNHLEHMGVSKNLGYPQIIHFNRVFHYKPSILGYPYFGNTHIRLLLFSVEHKTMLWHFYCTKTQAQHLDVGHRSTLPGVALFLREEYLTPFVWHWEFWSHHEVGPHMYVEWHSCIIVRYIFMHLGFIYIYIYLYLSIFVWVSVLKMCMYHIEYKNTHTYYCYIVSSTHLHSRFH